MSKNKFEDGDVYEVEFLEDTEVKTEYFDGTGEHETYHYTKGQKDIVEILNPNTDGKVLVAYPRVMERKGYDIMAEIDVDALKPLRIQKTTKTEEWIDV